MCQIYNAPRDQMVTLANNTPELLHLHSVHHLHYQTNKLGLCCSSKKKTRVVIKLLKLSVKT